MSKDESPRLGPISLDHEPPDAAYTSEPERPGTGSASTTYAESRWSKRQPQVFNIDTLEEVAPRRTRRTNTATPEEGRPVLGISSLVDSVAFSSNCSPASSTGTKYDIFLSHLQRNGQDAIICMQMFLQQAVPDITTFIDLDIEVDGNLEERLKDGVQHCGAFVFFITAGILSSKWCMQEYRWALQFGKKIVLVRETDERHGAVDMTDFLLEVPPDLKASFQNNIAIPWYRQPSFRKISVQEIVKATGVAQRYNVEALERAQGDLEATYLGSPDPITAFELVACESLAMRAVFFLGGFATFKNKFLNWLYVVIFNVSYWACGLLCAVNMLYQTLPYHVFFTDALTAYVHLPAWQSWLVWRKFVRSQDCDELVTKVGRANGNQALVSLACRVWGWCVLAVQVLMVSDVLLGFALPYLLQEEIEDHRLHYAQEFTGMHAWAMWLVIPPVIAAMFASYSMFAFIALLHILDIKNVRSVLLDCLADAFGSNGMTGISISGDDYLPHSPREDDLEVSLKRIAVQEKVLEAVAKLLMKLIERAQTRIDRTCNTLGLLWMHLVFFSTCQVLAVACALKQRAERGEETAEYEWFWGFQDFFHLGGGCVLLTAAMGIFCIVTLSMHRMRSSTLHVFIKAVPPPQRYAATLSVLSSRSLGMHVMVGSMFIDVPKVMGFLCVMGIVVLVQVIDSTNGADA